MVEIATGFLVGLDLARFVGDQAAFANELNLQTESLMSRFPEEAQGNWGAARKSLNLFLEEYYYHRFVYDYFQLQRIESFLEVPLDNQIARYLQEQAEKIAKKLPEFRGIKYLTRQDSKEYQDLALEIAERRGSSFLRVHLDLYGWRNEEN
jgi:hypothetical protein